MAFENENTLTASSKTTKQKFKKQSREKLAMFIRQLGRYQINLTKNLRAALNTSAAGFSSGRLPLSI